MIGVSNDGTHDFGYPCSMPREVTIDGLFVDDSNTPEGYQGMYFFADPDDGHDGVTELPPPEDRPYPYESCRRVEVRGLKTASGKKPRLSPSEMISGSTVVIDKD